MTKTQKRLICPIAVLLLAACGGSGGSSSSSLSVSPPRIRIVNAGIDAPALAVTASTASSSTLLVSGLAFGKATVYQHLAADSYDIDVNAILPDNSTQALIKQSAVSLTTSDDTSIYLAGSIAAGSSKVLEFNRPVVDVPSGKAELQVVHAAMAVPAVSVYVTAPGDALANATPVANLSFSNAGKPVNLAGGSYRIRITAENNPNTVYFDTGSTNTVALTAGESFQLAVIDSAGAGSTPVGAILLDGLNSTQPVLALINTAAPARLRVINASPDAGAIDVYASATGSGFTGSPRVSNLAYATEHSLCSFAAGTDDFEATASGAGPANPLAGLTSTDQTVNGGQTYALVAQGRTGGQPPATLTLSGIDERSVATEADLAFIHGAAALGVVDIYVTPAGSVTDAEIQSGAVNPTVKNFQPGQVGGNLRFAAGSYDIRVADAASNAIDIEQTGVALNAGLHEILTLLGPDESGSGGPQQPSLLTLPNGECP